MFLRCSSFPRLSIPPLILVLALPLLIDAAGAQTCEDWDEGTTSVRRFASMVDPMTDMYQSATNSDFQYFVVTSCMGEVCVWNSWIHDVRDPPLAGPFDLVLCRNLAFMYFDDAGQRTAALALSGVLRPGGALVVGKHETVPGGTGFEPWFERDRIWRRVRP